MTNLKSAARINDIANCVKVIAAQTVTHKLVRLRQKEIITTGGAITQTLVRLTTKVTLTKDYYCILALHFAALTQWSHSDLSSLTIYFKSFELLNNLF